MQGSKRPQIKVIKQLVAIADIDLLVAIADIDL